MCVQPNMMSNKALAYSNWALSKNMVFKKPYIVASPLDSYLVSHRFQIGFKAFLSLWQFDHLNKFVTWVEWAFHS